MDWKLRKKYNALLEQERGSLKKVWGTYHSVCLAYPNYYRVGMANLGFQTVYKILNDQPSFLCERLFLTAPEDDAEFASGAAGVVSLESQKPLRQFDILAFSLSFENDYPNVLKILAWADIPLLAAERDDDYPLIIGGGIAPTLNPEPLADFFDLFILGEAEIALPQFAASFAQAMRRRKSRLKYLADMQKNIPSVYVPSLYKVKYDRESRIKSVEPVNQDLPVKIKIKPIRDISAFATQEIISAPQTEMDDMFLVEINRGCGYYCRFCAAAYAYHPPRFRNAKLVLKSVSRGLKEKQKIGLVGTAVCDHPELMTMLNDIVGKNARAGISSLRIDRISPELIEVLKKAGVETIALAPEAGSQRMRDLLRKGITEADIVKAAEILIEKDIPNLRLYFMVGLPWEAAADIDAIIELAKKVQHTALRHTQGKRKFRRVTLSINQFIPKPHTPLQWCALEDVQAAGKKIKKIEGAFIKDKQIKVISDFPKWNYVQALLSLGDRRVGEILLAVQRLNGNWKKALKEVNINPDFYVYRHKSVKEILPWDIIELGVPKKNLASDYRKILKPGETG